jgi:Holliday junction DNA helicase RuvB
MSDSLRPQTFEEYIGQENTKEILKIAIYSAKTRQKPLPHQLFSGPPGLGKTTLAQIIANEMGSNVKITSGPTLEKPGDIAGTLIGLEKGDILFIDEIHRLHPTLEEFLYPAMEDKKLDILIPGENGSNKTLRIDLADFTLIGATTKPGSLTGPLRSRFQTQHKLEPYSLKELTQIVINTAARLPYKIEETAAEEIARRSRNTPRIANNHLLWVRDFCITEARETITKTLAKTALNKIGTNDTGLTKTDTALLHALVTQYNGGPVGLQTLALACGEDAAGVEEIQEPYLIQNQFIKRTAQGRVALEKAYILFELPIPSSLCQKTLL